MTTRRIGIALAAVVVVLVATGIGRSAWRRAQEPKYEGRTAAEWVEYLAPFAQHGNLTDAQAQKEGEIAFRSLDEPGQRFLIHEYLSYERPTGLKTNLYAWAEKLPSGLRLPFLRSPGSRIAASRELLELIRPPWETFLPEITDAFAAGGDRALAATLLLGYVGRGGTNAAPLLVSPPTNVPPNWRFIALQALANLETNAAPALPALISWTEPWTVTGIDPRILNAIAACGEQASAVSGRLDELLATSTRPVEQRVLATALLRTQPAHTAAYRMLEEQLRPETDQSGNIPRDILLSFLLRHGPPNPAFSRLATPLIGSRTHWHMAAQVMLRHDPVAGVAVLHRKLADQRFDTEAMGVLDLLLRHDPSDEVALKVLESHVRNDFFPRNQLRMVLVQSYCHCLPDSPGVVELLKSIQPAPDDDALRKAIRETLRHIELNGRLKELRERDAAAGR